MKYIFIDTGEEEQFLHRDVYFGSLNGAVSVCKLKIPKTYLFGEYTSMEELIKFATWKNNYILK